MSKLTISTLYQQHDWIDLLGNVHPIREIDARYAHNIIAFLRRRRLHIEFAIDLSWVDADDWHESQLSMDDLMELPVVEALRRRLDPDHEWWLPLEAWPISVETCSIVHWLLSMLVVAFNPLLPPTDLEPYE